MADAFVELKAEDTGLRQDIDKRLKEAGAGQSIKVGEEVEPGSFEALKAKVAEHVRAAELGAKVKVSLENDATAKLRAEITAMVRAAGLGQSVKIKVESDEKSWADVKKKFSEGTSMLTRDWGKAMAGMKMIALGPAITAVGQLTGGVVALTGVTANYIGQLSGVGALLPAIGLAGVSAMSSLKMGVSGVGAAMKVANTAGELKAQQEALAQLTPEARKFAEAGIALRPVWKAMQDEVQETLWKNLAGDLSVLGNQSIPVLRTGMVGMAGEWNQIISRVLQFGASSVFVKDLALFFNNTTLAMHKVTPALVPILNIFRNLAAVGSSFLPYLADHFAQAAIKAALFVQEARNTGKLQQYMQGGIDAVRSLWNWLKDVWAILKDLAAVGKEFSGTVGGGIAGATDRLREFVHQARESGKLKEYMQTGLDAFKQLGGIIGDLIGLIRALASSSIPFLGTLGLIVGALRWMAENVPGLLPVVGALFLAFKFVQIAIAVVKFVQAAQIAIEVIKAWTVVQWLLNVAMDANPIGLIILAIGALIAIVAVIIYNWDTLKRWFGNFWDWFQKFFKEWGPTILAIVAPFIGIPLLIYQNWDKIKGWLGGIWDWAKKFFKEWGPTILAIVAPFIGIPLLIYQNWDKIRGWLKGVWDGVVNLVKGGVLAAIKIGSDFINFIKGIPGQVGDALSGLGGSIIDGIWRGLQNGWNWLVDQVKNLARMLLDAAKAALGIGSPSKAFEDELGAWLPPGVAKGVEKATPVARRAVGAMAQTLLADVKDLQSRIELTPGTMTAGGTARTLGPWYRPAAPTPTDTAAPAGSKLDIGNLHLHIAGNLDPTDPVAWRQALESLRKGIRDVERSYI